MIDDEAQREQDTQIHFGGCLCGAVRYQLTGPLRPVVNCHCGQCRRSHGHYAAYSSVDLDKLRFIADQGLTWYQSSESAQRGFCRHCGSSLFWHPVKSARYAVAAGSLDQPTSLATVAHIFIEDKADYYEISDDLEQRTRGLG